MPRILGIAALTLFLLLSSAKGGGALERRAVPFPDASEREWTGSASCNVQYYNTCTGWIWTLRDFPSHTRFGVSVETCCATSATLTRTWYYVVSAAPVGWGYTGTLSIHAADANACPVDPPLDSTPFGPTTGWNANTWSVPVPSHFVIRFETGTSGGWNDLAMALDHPAAGPTGPQSCGLCYPTTRVNRSFYYGSASAPLCPGEIFLFDGTCDAQLLLDCDLVCGTVSVEPETWGRIKTLFR